MTRRDAILNVFGAVFGATVVSEIRPEAQTASAGSSRSSLTRVLVVDAATRKRVPNARVFVLSDASGLLAEVRTDGDGLAVLPEIPPNKQPKYVFAEAQ